MIDRRLACCLMIGGLIGRLAADSVPPSGNEILARVESESNRRHVLLKEYSGSRQYMMQNARFGKQAAVAVLVNYRQVEGKHYTVLTRSGSGKLNGIIDQVLASEAGASLPPEDARHQISAANYRVHLLGTEVAAGRSCYALELAPRMKSRFLIERLLAARACAEFDIQFAAWPDPTGNPLFELPGRPGFSAARVTSRPRTMHAAVVAIAGKRRI
jgi:hypothetical protein